MKIGFIGLGRMGSNMVKKLVEDGHEVVVWTRSESTISNFKAQISNSQLDQSKLAIATSVENLIKRLQKPRVVWSMVPVGEATDEVLSEVDKYVERNDIVIDGGNAFYKDTQRRYDELRIKNIKFLGIGVAGGVHGPKLGYALMAGGDKSAYEHATLILDTLAKPTAGHEYYGQGGAGHFVKMVHNGIEYGYMQAIGEGFDLLKHAPYKYDLVKIAKQWAKNSLVSGFMMDRAVEALSDDPTMEKLEGIIDATGEGQWTVETAKELGVPVEIIEAALNYRKRSKTDKKIQSSFTAKMVAALRQAFGGHGVKKKEQ